MPDIENVFETLSDIYTKQVEEADLKGYADLFKKVTDLFFEDLNIDTNDVPFTFTDIEYLNGYFIFGTGTNSVIHFHIKECPGWKFGIWWDEPEVDTKICGHFFAQYEENIDKFKPSASIIKNDFCIKGLTINYWDTHYIRKAIEFIMNEPYLAFCRDYYCYDYNETYVSREEAKKIYDDWRAKTDKGIKLTKKWDDKILKWVKDNILPIFINAEIKDMGEGWSPRYEVFAPFSENSDIVNAPGCYSWYADEKTEEDIELLKEFDALMEAAQKEFREEIDSCYFYPIHQSIIFYNNEEEENDISYT